MRDFDAEMLKAIRDATSAEEFVVLVEANRLHDYLVENDPELLDGWLRRQAVRILAQTIRDDERFRRIRARSQGTPRAFAAAAKSGDPERLSVFAAHLVVSTDNTRRTIGQMTGADHLFVAGRYGREANRAKMLESFHRAVAARVGDAKTCEVFTEPEYLAMYNSVVGPVR